jgi:hypothetical protein
LVRRWRFLVVVVASVFAFAGTAQAVPTYLSPIDLSDAGQDAFEPQVAVDSSGNVHSVWTRSVGPNLRIQYATRTANGSWSAPINISDAGQSASQPQLDVDPSGNLLVVWSRTDGTNLRTQSTFKPSGGSFSAPVNVSDPGFDASAPQVDFDSTGKAILVWSRFDGTNLRVQSTIRSAGSGGTYLNEVTLSQGGRDAFEARTDAGPNADANAVIVWTRSDGTKLRVQSARRRDVTGFLRPKSATTFRVPLAPAYNACNGVTANRQHGPPLAFPSCNPPVKSSAVLTIGTPDSTANMFTAAANSASSVKFRAGTGNTATEANEADVAITTRVDDVRKNDALGTDHVGPILIRTNLQITDNRNADEQPESGTSQVLPLQWPVQCVATPTDNNRGSNCIQSTTVNALLPGAVQESRRTIWEFGQVTVLDAGPNGTGYAACPPTCGDGDETTFMRQAVYVP